MTGRNGRPWVRGVTRAIKKRAFTRRIPRCRGADHVETWLEELNFLIGQSANFANGTAYELLDLEQGSDLYRVLLCRKGYKIPKSAMWKDDG
jgi:hypothetical protein